MPGIARKLIICAAIDGLIIQPLPSKGQRLMRPVQISYGDSQITPASRDELPDSSEPDSSFEAFGIIGTGMHDSCLSIQSDMVLQVSSQCQD